VSKAYADHYKAIWPHLPASAQALEKYLKRYSLHDEGINAFAEPSRREFHIDLDTRRLEFTGVTDLKYPRTLEEGTIWLLDEIDSAPGGRFVFRGLLDSSDDISVTAEAVRVYDKLHMHYVFPDEPPPPQSTLFLDRKHTQKRNNKR
jgi:hypothetical protein